MAILIQVTPSEVKVVKSKTIFSTVDAAKVRQMLSEKENADRDEQKAIRRRVRKLGFYIEDFRTSHDPFTAADFDALIKTGAINVS